MDSIRFLVQVQLTEGDVCGPNGMAEEDNGMVVCRPQPSSEEGRPVSETFLAVALDYVSRYS